MLKEKDVVSGEELSKKLGVSRTGIWKNVQHLVSLGYKIEAIPGKGYNLSNVPDLLYPWELSLGDIFFDNIYYFKNIESTNKYAANLDPLALVLAEEQSAGRGRLSRNWVSNSGGIYCTLVAKPELSLDRLPALSLVVSTALAETLIDLYDLDVKIKWPNDILVNDKKMAGILIEAAGEMDGFKKVIIGIGLNANLELEEFASELKSQVTTIKHELLREVDRKELVNKMVKNILETIDLFQKKPDSVLDRWSKISATLGKEVVATGLKEGQIRGRALEIDEQGSLILQGNDGQKKRIISGDVTLCRKKGG